MKTLTVPGDPTSMTAIMVDNTEQFMEHDVIRINSADGDQSVEKKIFRIVDAGEDKLELQFE